MVAIPGGVALQQRARVPVARACGEWPRMHGVLDLDGREVVRLGVVEHALRGGEHPQEAIDGARADDSAIRHQVPTVGEEVLVHAGRALGVAQTRADLGDEGEVRGPHHIPRECREVVG